MWTFLFANLRNYRRNRPVTTVAGRLTQAAALPKLYHIVHVDRLGSILADGCLFCDAAIGNRQGTGTMIGMSTIKRRRLTLELSSHPGLYVGSCVPFYFCPRSVMLYLLYQANHPDLAYRGGQGPIVHLERDLHAVANWANTNAKRWAFTLSNAGARYFEDRCDLNQLHEINWNAVNARKWAGPGISSQLKEGKQAEVLVEEHVPWELVERIGVFSKVTYQNVANAIAQTAHRPVVEVRPEWYYRRGER